MREVKMCLIELVEKHEKGSGRGGGGGGSSAYQAAVRGAVSATQVAYVVVDIPKYAGPVVFEEHPTWVPIVPVPVKHKRFRGRERLQLPLVLVQVISSSSMMSLHLISSFLVHLLMVALIHLN